MAHTEKCRGCIYENACDFISCRQIENENIRNKAIDDCLSAFADWYGYNYENQGYYKLLKQMKKNNK